MSRKRFNAEQIVPKLRQIEVVTAGGKARAQACKVAGSTNKGPLSRPTIY